jgi:phosphate uptake regulator
MKSFAPREEPETGRSPARGFAEPAEVSERVAQRMGGVTLGLSLPREWVELTRVKVGTRLQVETLRDGSLRIATDLRTVPRASCEIDVASAATPEHTFRRLIGAFVSGLPAFSIVEPGGISSATRSIVRSFQRRTGHVETVSEDHDSLRLQVISEGESVPILRRVRRAAEIVSELHRKAGEALAQPSGFPSTDWQRADDEVDRETWFIQRRLARLPGTGLRINDPVEEGYGALDCWAMARSLERIGDHAVLIGEEATQLGDAAAIRPERRGLAQVHAQALQQFDSVVGGIEDIDSRKANDLLDTGEALQQAARTLAERMSVYSRPLSGSSGTIVALDRILQSIERTIAYTQDIAEVMLDARVATASSPDQTGTFPRHPPFSPSPRAVATGPPPGKPRRRNTKRDERKEET